MRIERSSLQCRDGFTMVVLAALFIAFAVIAAVVVERNAATQLINRRDATVEQLRRLSIAIMQYGVFNSGGPGGTTMLYPCPAQEFVNTSDPTFGTSVANCYSTAGDTASATSTGIPILGADVIRGMVPVQTLAQYGININDAFDPWNNRIEYVVNRRLTPGSGTIAGAQTSNPTVTDIDTGHAIPPPDFILISYGRDGLGGIRRNNTAVSIACPNPGTVLRQYNCDVNTTFYIAPTYTAATATSANYFDDILSYYRQ